MLSGNGKSSPLLFWWVSVGVVVQSGAAGVAGNGKLSSLLF